jgi:hypothetical protein
VLLAQLALTIVCVVKDADDTMRAAALPPEVRARFEVLADAVSGPK